VQAGRTDIQDPSFIQPQRTSPVTSDRVKFHVVFVPPTRLYCTNLLPELTLLTMLSVVLLIQSGIRLATTLSLVLPLLYLSLPLRHSYFVRHSGLVGSHDRNLSVSASGVFDILARLLGRLLRVDLIKWVSNVRSYVRPSTKSFFDFNEIWYVGRGR